MQHWAMQFRSMPEMRQQRFWLWADQIPPAWSAAIRWRGSGVMPLGWGTSLSSSLPYSFIVLRVCSLVLGHDDYQWWDLMPALWSMSLVPPKQLEEEIKSKWMQESYPQDSSSDGGRGAWTPAEWIGNSLPYACVSLKWYLIKTLQALATKGFAWLSLA